MFFLSMLALLTVLLLTSAAGFAGGVAWALLLTKKEGEQDARR